MVECGICLEEYQEGNLKLHRQICMIRLMFRCSLCHEDYMNKEGLWNHLDLHEIADESKELHYQEIKAKHKLHQCILCNDQRAYSESSYLKHVHDVHDGFLLRCSDCGEKFRSEQLKNEHACSRCALRDETVASDFNALKNEPVPTEVENTTSGADHLKLTWGEQRGIANEELNNGLAGHSRGQSNYNIIDKKSALPTISSTKSNDLTSQFACDICGVTFSSKGLISRHKKIKYACMDGGLHKCPHCRRLFRLKEYQPHITLCEKKKFSCELCPVKFKTSKNLRNHIKVVHRDIVSSLKSSPNSNVDDEGTDRGKKDIADESMQQPPSRSSGSSSGTKCLQCGKECVRASRLRQHIVQTHQPTKCSICAITFEGLSKVRYHKITCHIEPKYECPNCGKKFHRKKEFDAHCFACQDRKYLCKLCGKTFKLFRSAKEHNERRHPEKMSFRNFQIILEQKQVQDNEPEMEITAEETTISARDDQGQSTVNSSLKVDVANSRSNERSSANLNDDEFMDSQVIDKDSRMLSVAPSNGGSERQVVLEKTSQSLVENRYSCNICGNKFQSYSTLREHKLTKHTEAKYQCPHCPRKIHHRRVFDKHVPLCAKLKHSCELCGRKYNHIRKVKDHKKRIHKSNRPLRNADIEGADCTEQQKQISVEKVDVAQEMNSCIICRFTFASTDELMKHKLHCTRHGKVHDDSQFGAKENSMLHDVKGNQNDSTTVMQDENIDLKMEIKVEETMLQGQEYQHPNDDPGRSFATVLDPHDGKLMDVEAEDADDLETFGIKVKEECLEDEAKIETEHQTTTESEECYEVPMDRN